MPGSTDQQRRLKTFEVAYQNLYRSVLSVVRAQLGDEAYIKEEIHRADRLRAASERVRCVF